MKQKGFFKKYFDLDESNGTINTILLAAFIVIGIPVILSLFPYDIGKNYSNGVRDGKLQKYSIKGLFNKSGEGEVILQNISITKNGGGFEKFCFSDDKCRDFSFFVGKDVEVYYTQFFHRSSLFTETNYQIDSIKVKK